MYDDSRLWYMITDGSSRPLGSINFSVFSSDDFISRRTIEKFYRLEDECNGKEECRNKIWTSIYPDPKSDINEFDSGKGMLH